MQGSPGGENALEKVEAIALELFARNGFRETTANEIAEAAGISRATLFRHFGSKEGIVFSNHPRGRAALIATVRRHPGALRHRDEMVALLAEYLAWLERDGELLGLRVQVIASDEQLLARAMLARDDFADAIACELDGPEPSLSTQVLAASAMAAMQLTVRTWRLTGMSRPLDELLDESLGALALWRHRD